MIDNKLFEKVITPRHRLLDLHLEEAFRSLDLVYLFTKRDLTVAYKQTIIGPFWYLLSPIISTIAFVLVFDKLAGLPILDIEGNWIIPSFLFYMSGNICWSLFANTLSSCSNTFLGNIGLMGKVYFPRILVPISNALTNLVHFFVQLFLFFVLYITVIFTSNTSIVFSAKILLLFPIILEVLVLAVGCGLIVSSATTRYRDLNMVVGVIVRFWQYATPIMYGLSLVTKKIPSLIWLYMLNPMTIVATAFRYSIFGIGYFDPVYYLVSIIISLMVFFIGLIMFSKTERYFIDII